MFWLQQVRIGCEILRPDPSLASFSLLPPLPLLSVLQRLLSSCRLKIWGLAPGVWHMMKLSSLTSEHSFLSSQLCSHQSVGSTYRERH